MRPFCRGSDNVRLLLYGFELIGNRHNTYEWHTAFDLSTDIPRRNDLQLSLLAICLCVTSYSVSSACFVIGSCALITLCKDVIAIT